MPSTLRVANTETASITVQMRLASTLGGRAKGSVITLAIGGYPAKPGVTASTVGAESGEEPSRYVRPGSQILRKKSPAKPKPAGSTTAT